MARGVCQRDLKAPRKAPRTIRNRSLIFCGMTKRYERYRTYLRNPTRYIEKSVRVRRQLERVDVRHPLAWLFDL
jgi:hypothetical protein